MRTLFFLAIALLLFASAPAFADRAEECRRRCGDDTACYRRCMGAAWAPYNYPRSRGWGHHGYRHRSYRSGEPSNTPAAPTEAAPTDAAPPMSRSIERRPTQPRRRVLIDRAPEPSTSNRPVDSLPTAAPSILGTAYDLLYGKGGETEGYGLYSYVILPRVNDRNAAFLSEILTHFPSAQDLPTAKNRINILYIPTKPSSKGKVSFSNEVSAGDARKFLSSAYDFAMAQELLYHLCDQPAPAVAQLCQSDLADGPYLLTYARQISDRTPLPPPFLFLDLTNVHPRAFKLFVSAYASQVKRPDFSDGDRVDDFHLSFGNITLTAADWVRPISAAVSDLLHHAEAKANPAPAPK